MLQFPTEQEDKAETAARICDGLMKSWGSGYDAAIRVVREVADKTSDEKTKSTFAVVADILEKTRP